MSHLTIREASRLIGRTPATIRRYIRSGRLRAGKDVGKFGEEYHIEREDLLALGFSPTEATAPPETGLTRAPSPLPAPAAAPIDGVPLALYNELLMKHEQMLVQYGMIRAGGQKLYEYKADAEAKAEEIERQNERYQVLRQRALKEIGLLRKRLREMEIQLQEKDIEITLLRDKARRLEGPAPGRSPVEAFEAGLVEVRQKQQAVAELLADDPRRTAAGSDPWGRAFPPLDRKDDH